MFIPVVFYFIGLKDPKFATLSLFSFCFFISLYMIFENSLTEEGEITILFELLSTSINNFHDALKYWEKLAKKIERMLREANIQLSSKDLLYHFGKRLLETTDDISNDLLGIREWMLGRERSCFNGLQGLNPKIELEKCKRNFILEWFYQNPDKLVKYGVASIIFVIVVAFNPNSITTILKELGISV